MTLDASMLAPITTAIISNMNVLLPVGITIMSVMIGVSLIPRIVYKFLPTGCTPVHQHCTAVCIYSLRS
jgi:hypothetical protein